MRIYFLLIFIILSDKAFSQTVLLSENFNASFLPVGWNVEITGNQQALWYVGTPTNSKSDGSTIDGTKLLIIDDEDTGINSPGFALSVKSPAFNASSFPFVFLDADIHYRDNNSNDETFKILVTDGTTEKLVYTFTDINDTGNQFSDFVHLRLDLSMYFTAPNMRVIFRYDDGGGDWSWWAGVDNVVISGEGAGTIVTQETFNTCAQPAGWTSQLLSGAEDWKYGVHTRSNGDISTMNGSCFVYFDDEVLESDTPATKIRLVSPWFDGTVYETYQFSCEMIFRHKAETVNIYVEQGNGHETLIHSLNDDLGGTAFAKYKNLLVNISSYRDPQMRIIIEYDDHDEWGWWLGVDNFKIIGNGSINDLCASAITLTTGMACTTPKSSEYALFNGTVPACNPHNNAGSLWYKWKATFTGLAKFTTEANFNDIITVFTGTCTANNAVYCNNKDEHGFEGETSYFNVTNGTDYLIRVNGQTGAFGKSRGSVCAAIAQAAALPPTPANDDCANAIVLNENAPCTVGSSLHAATGTTLPSENLLARADIWYRFTAPALTTPGDLVEITSGSDFSDVIALYSGSCSNLQEVDVQETGQILRTKTLTPGQTYYVQVAGNFATVEGNVCMRWHKNNVQSPTNDVCSQATLLALGDTCLSISNEGAQFEGAMPTCVLGADKDIWFRFVAPPSGRIKINTGAAFTHVLAVWSGTCNNLVPIYCQRNPLPCDGYQTIQNLTAGQQYYIQIASWNNNNPSANYGDVCISLLEGYQNAPYDAFQLKVVENCVGIGISEVDFILTGGVEPYSVEGTQDLAQLPSGEEYLMVATDARGCIKSYTGVAAECSACGLMVASEVKGVDCYDGNDGSIFLTVSGGGGNYEYNWSNSDIAGNGGSGLKAGVYSVTITDSNGCSTVYTRAVPSPAQITISPTTVTNPHFGQMDGVLSVMATGGAAPYLYEWSLNGSGMDSTTTTITHLGPGLYTVEVEDDNGCITSISYPLVEVPVSTSTADVDVFGASLFPNPAHEVSFIKVVPGKNSIPNAMNVNILDISGKLLQSLPWTNPSSGNLPIHTKNLPAGMYFVQLKSDGKTLGQLKLEVF